MVARSGECLGMHRTREQTQQPHAESAGCQKTWRVSDSPADSAPDRARRGAGLLGAHIQTRLRSDASSFFRL